MSNLESKDNRDNGLKSPITLDSAYSSQVVMSEACEACYIEIWRLGFPREFRVQKLLETKRKQYI